MRRQRCAIANDRKASVSAGADVNEPRVWKLVAHDGECEWDQWQACFILENESIKMNLGAKLS